MSPTEQIILQTLGDAWMCLAFSVIIAFSIQAVRDFKGIQR